MRVTLAVRDGLGAGQRFVLSEDRAILIGRAASNDVVLSHPDVSEYHCLVAPGRSPGEVVLTDARSSHGTLVNGAPFSKGLLAAGDVIAIGPFELALCPALPEDRPPEAARPVADRPARFELAAVGESGPRHPLSPGSATLVGRSPCAHIRLDDPFVSDFHCLLALDPADEARVPCLVDLHSSNGTHVQDRPIYRTHVLRGDVLTIGQCYFRVVQVGAASPQRAEPPVGAATLPVRRPTTTLLPAADEAPAGEPALEPERSDEAFAAFAAEMPAASATEAAEPAAPASAAPAAAAPAAPPLAEGTPEPPFDLAALAQRAASCEMFFGFDDPPFRLAPDPDYLFHSPAYTRALSVLVEWLRTGPPIGVLFGEPGCGKSLLVASLARRFDYRRPVPVVIRPTRGESARDVLIEAALGRAAALHGQLPREGADPLERWREVVAELRRRNVLTIFLVDDAHRLPEANLRAFAELVDGEAARVAVRALLVGCEPLRRVVAAPPLSPHLGAACALGPLDSDEVGSYIAHRILIASGKSDPFFTQRAIELIADYSRGVPRLINVAASAALFCAFRAGHRVVTHEAVGEALRDALGVGTAPGAAPA